MTHNFEVDGRRVLGFDTGFDSRAFAQAKFVRFITEPGLIVRLAETKNSRGSVETWKASGVREVTGTNGNSTMVVWGPFFEGNRLDLLLNEPETAPQDNVLKAISIWIQAILALKENSPELTVPLRPCTAIIGKAVDSDPSVFFMAPGLAERCIAAAKEPALSSNNEKYIHPDLCGMEAAAFTASAMLYRVFAGTHPFPADDKSLLHQDIREGNFLPICFAVPGVDTRFAALIQDALAPPADKKDGQTVDRMAILDKILEILQMGGQAVSLVHPLAESDLLLLEKEKKQFLKTRSASVKIKRFVTRNKTLLLGCLAAFVVIVFVIATIAQNLAGLPTTAGMNPTQVIESYYSAIGALDYRMMEACITRGTGKDDINMVMSFFALNKMRQAYKFGAPPLLVSAHEWQQGEAELLNDSRIFGVTDLHIKSLTGDENNNEIYYQINYTLWIPASANDETAPEMDIIEDHSSRRHYCSDLVTLVRKNEKWRISDIKRKYMKLFQN